MPTQTSPPYTPYTVSPQLLARPEFHKGCAERDFGEIFRLMRKYDGASQDRICSPVEGLTQSRVSRIMRGVDHISGLAVIERIADALHIPGQLLGIADREWEVPAAPEVGGNAAGSVAESAGLPVAVLPVGDGEVIDRHVHVEIVIAEDGWSRITYRHELYNGTSTPFTRLSRELWFEHSAGPLNLKALRAEDDRNVIIQRIHDAPGYTKFACQLFPALAPGESMIVSYTCDGGQFIDDHYWRQGIWRSTGQLSLRLRLQGVQSLTGCSAVEERPDGSEISATESLTWQEDSDGVAIDLTRHDLRANQSVTLRWAVPRVTA